MSTDPVTRRAIAQRAIDRAKARGTPIDDDTIFIALLDRWISGDIDMRTVRDRYFGSLALRQEQRHDAQSDGAGTSRDNDGKKKRADGVNRGP